MNIPDILHFPESVHGQTYQRPNERCLNLSICLEIIKNQYRKSLSLLSILDLERRKMAGLHKEWDIIRCLFLQSHAPLSSLLCPVRGRGLTHKFPSSAVPLFHQLLLN